MEMQTWVYIQRRRKSGLEMNLTPVCMERDSGCDGDGEIFGEEREI